MTLSAITLFCEDVRFEHDGKRTFVGVLQDTYSVPEYPFKVPRLIALTILRWSQGNLPERIHVSYGLVGEEKRNIELPESSLEQLRRASPSRTDDVGISTLEIGISLADLNIQQPSNFTVHIHTGTTSIHAGVLRFETSPPEEKD